MAEDSKVKNEHPHLQAMCEEVARSAVIRAWAVNYAEPGKTSTRQELLEIMIPYLEKAEAWWQQVLPAELRER
tara:strand:- start:838 stop:1056 length:219 start_codon:yes stop_codon:yes gene_type:complete